MRRAPAIVLLTLAVHGCDDAEVGERFAVDASVDGSATDAGAATPTDAAMVAMDGGLHASIDASADAAAAERDAATADAAALPYARGVQSLREGTNAGHGRDDYPNVVLGPPSGKGRAAGSLDVLSLGVGGEIVLDFGARAIVDGAGPDFIVFENAFLAGGVNQAAVYAELGEVSVSDDLTTWQTFPCSLQSTTPGVYPGCAGWTPTLEYDPFAVVPLDPARTGGDSFDLNTVSVSRARYVRVRDLSTTGQGTTAGFDLDAIGVIHASE